jgi:hypothetical protein
MLEIAIVWKVLQEFWTTYQYKHYGKKRLIEDSEGIIVDNAVEESDEEDWRIKLEDDDKQSIQDEELNTDDNDNDCPTRT